MNAKAAKTKITEITIIDLFMDYVLQEEKLPKSVYKFCKLNSIKEEEFYNYFGSITGLQRSIWSAFYENTLKVMQKDKAYQSYAGKDKMLTFYFTFFELLALNRSYVLFALEENKSMLKNAGQLSVFRRHFKSFASDLITAGNSEKPFKILQQNTRIFSEGAWLQFVFLLKFWIEDDSPGFEKTDVAIEKSVNTVFEVFDNSPIERILDLGKFLYKESFV